MKPFLGRILTVAFLCAGVLRGADSLDEAMQRATLDYGERLRAANAELVQTRERIARERAPLLLALRAAEDRIVGAQAEITRLETGQEQSADLHRKLLKDSEALRKNESYLGTVAHDSLGAFSEGLLPGERQLDLARLQALEEQFNDASHPGFGQQAVDVANFLAVQVQRELGGYLVAGDSLVDGDNRMVKGTFALAGPEAFFRAEQTGAAGTVRVREGTGHPVTYVLRGWKPADSAAFFAGQMGPVFADASAGKALRLQEAKGTVWQHINKGGIVSYAILCVGLLALFMIGQKIRDLARMKVDEPAAVQGCLDILAAGSPTEAEKTLRNLRGTTRELFAVGFRHLGKPKEIIEEHLYAVLLRQRLHYERWLPLLAVIATAAPLMGLLGTVTGMVRTFALITVFGTGNAGKLASGISEVLVSTELGLMVAIPTLIAHGFISHRIQKNLSLLERYALEFVTAAQPDQTREESRESLTV